MVRWLGATHFHRGDDEAAAEADIVIECTGFVAMLLEVGPQMSGGSPASPASPRPEAESAIDPGLQPQHGPAELRPVRLGQRQPAPLRTGRPGARPGRPRPGPPGLMTREVPISRMGRTRTPASPTTSTLFLTFPDRSPQPRPCAVQCTTAAVTPPAPGHPGRPAQVIAAIRKPNETPPHPRLVLWPPQAVLWPATSRTSCPVSTSGGSVDQGRAGAAPVRG